MIRARVVPVLACALVVAAGACTTPSSSAERALDELHPPTTTTTTTTEPALPPCTRDPLASFRPDGPNPAPGDMPAGSYMQEIQERGWLLVGVDENTQGLSFRDPSDGVIKGMEVELAYELARRIFGDRPREEIVELVPVITEEKTDVVDSGDVDLTISAVSMTCRRWDHVAFSTEYLTTDQRFLVRTNSPIQTAEDLSGRTVCVTERSSSADILSEHLPDVELLEVDARTDCLVALQQGRADAYFGHDTFLRGMVLQDPTTEVRSDVLSPDIDTASHYGIPIAHEHPEFVRFVNQALDEMRADGTWGRLHDGLEGELGLPDAAPPAPVYGAVP
jgi:polar amino acid transport system substrate-binding protein